LLSYSCKENANLGKIYIAEAQVTSDIFEFYTERNQKQKNYNEIN